jgi:hypothetical protein
MPQPSPPRIQLPFAAGAGGGFINTPIPVASQIGITPGAASYTDGFPPLSMTAPNAGGVPPFGQDVNGILFALSSHIAALEAGQGYVYDATLSAAIGGYAAGAVLQRADGTGYWLNSSGANNTTNPDTGGAGWVPYSNYGATALALTTGAVTLTVLQAAKPQILLTGTLTGNVILVFPSWALNWFVFNGTANNGIGSGFFTITAQVAGGTGTILQQGANQIAVNGTAMINALARAGTFPATYQGITGSPTNTAYYRIAGGVATITLPAIAPTASTSIQFYSSIPAFLVPPSGGGVPQPNVSIPIAMDNSAYQTGGAFVVIGLSGGVPRMSFALNASSLNWTGSGNKLVAGTFSYDLNPGVS